MHAHTNTLIKNIDSYFLTFASAVGGGGVIVPRWCFQPKSIRTLIELIETTDRYKVNLKMRETEKVSKQDWFSSLKSPLSLNDF